MKFNLLPKLKITLKTGAIMEYESHYKTFDGYMETEDYIFKLVDAK